MRMERTKLLPAYFLARWRVLLAFAAFSGIYAAVYLLYHEPLEPVLYAGLLTAALGAGIGVTDFLKYRRRHMALRCQIEAAGVTLDRLPEAGDLLERDYQELAAALSQRNAALVSEADSRLSERMDYYTLWTHQIKTPIAAMRLLLQEEETRTGELEQELFKIEQYADMALQYQRLESLSSDLQLESCSLDGILRQALKKMATPFIRRRISLEFDGTGATVLTDEKWLTFVVEQLLSNALKYTPPGGRITLYLEADKTLVVEDNGIGIRAEDIPRIFERGFTGFNGRMDKKSTGIGLYLCRRILSRLSHTIAIESRPGEGTRVRVGLASQAIELQ